MRLSRLIPRFTVLRLMVVVAIIGSALGVTIERSQRFRFIASRHRGVVPLLPPMKPIGMPEKDWRRFEWHQSMARKYEYAAYHPWLPVAADPPEPR